MGFDKPYMVTEWGAIGHWEVPKTSWGAPIEQSYRTAIASDPQRVLGSYVFLWGQKQERTPTWYGMFLEDGTETEAVDVMQYVWTGAWPENRSPQIHSMLLDSAAAHQNVELSAGEQYQAIVSSSDPDGDTLRYQWQVMQESQATQTGGDREVVPAEIPGLVVATGEGQAVVTAPMEPGASRLFVYVHDDKGHAGHANIPFQVKG